MDDRELINGILCASLFMNALTFVVLGIALYENLSP